LLCATDRRLTIADTGEIVSERSTKLTRFSCLDATGLITYNGIGKDDRGETPSEWLQQFDSDTRFSAKPLVEAVELIRLGTEIKIRRLPSNVDKRHTFVICALYESMPVIALISNYESTLNDSTTSAQSEFRSTWTGPNKNVGLGSVPPTAAMATGSTQLLDRQRFVKVCERVRARSPPEAIRQLCIGLIRRAANSQKGGPVGTSVLWAILDLNTQGCECGLDVLGGSSIQEIPNLVTPIMSIKDAYVTGGDFLGNKAFAETPCQRCGAPVPFGYNRCGVCDAPFST
jgi:hypothetical protein